MAFLYNIKQVLSPYAWWGNTAYEYFLAGCIFVGLMIVLKIFQLLLLHQLKRWATFTKTALDDALLDYVETIGKSFYIIVSVWIASLPLDLPDSIEHGLYAIFLLAIIVQIIRIIENVAVFAIDTHVQKNAEKFDRGQNKTMVRLAKLGIRVSLWVVGLITILSNMGLDVTSLVASLGIGGLAIALALQNILGDMFSSFSIYMDKPFEVGDFIVVGENSGTVKRVGLKTTRLKTLQGEELIISNNELTDARIQNFKKLERRRVVFTFGVTYETDADKLAAIPTMIQEIIDAVDGVKFGRCHLDAYADSSLNFEAVYHVDDASYDQYMDRKQEIHLAVFKKFAAEGISFAYPTQTVYVNKLT